MSAVLCAALVAFGAGCSDGSPPEERTSGWSDLVKEATTTTEPATTTSTTDPCEDAVAQSIAALDALLDRVDQVRTVEELDSIGDVTSEAMRESGALVGAACGLGRAGGALSEIIVWMSGEATGRPLNTQSYISGFLPVLCEFGADLDLTAPARLACAGR